jgi:hypothetical protein
MSNQFLLLRSKELLNASNLRSSAFQSPVPLNSQAIYLMHFTKT